MNTALVHMLKYHIITVTEVLITLEGVLGNSKLKYFQPLQFASVMCAISFFEREPLLKKTVYLQSVLSVLNGSL